MYTLKELLQEVALRLKQIGVIQPIREAEEMISSSLKIPRDELFFSSHTPISISVREEIFLLLARRERGEPLEYLLEQVTFYNCTLQITPAVLIPRVETELLIDNISQKLEKEDLKGKILFDICAGSGCIGIALKKRFPTLCVLLSDLSQEALSLAQKNAEKNGVEVTCLLGDLFTPFKDQKAHFIVSNPPYVSLKEYEKLESSVKDFEPKMALVGGEDGLLFYRRFMEQLPHHLYPQAKVFFEIGSEQGESVKKLFTQLNPLTFELLQDWSLKDRFFFLEFE